MKKSSKNKGIMKVLMIIRYKDMPIYIRLIGESVFIWDVIYDGQLFSSYIVIDPVKDKKILNKGEIEEVIKMCYAGAAATIDNILGVELTEKEKDMLKKFEEAKLNIDKVAN